MAASDKTVCAITAAMQHGTGLDQFAADFPSKFFDVGIAEGHAVCMAAGLAKQGMKPVAAIYSTFLQRAYDMLLHDVALQQLHVVLAVDRCGIVGEDGDTHQGMFATLACFPNLPAFEYLMQTPEGSNDFSGLPQLLGARKLDNLYVYNGDFAWDNQSGFFGRQGMSNFIGRFDYKNPVVFDPTWGVSDQDMFDRAAEELSGRSGEKPFYAVLQTLSNHTPYALPQKLPVEPVTGEGSLDQHLTAMRYSDWALGQFFEKVRKAPFFKETLFVILGDHGFGSGEQLTEMNLARFNVPLLLIAPGIQEKFGGRRDTVGTQVDVVPTIMGRLGGTVRHQCWGRDLLNLPAGDRGFGVIKPSGSDQTVAIVSDHQLLVQSKSKALKLYDYQLWTAPRGVELKDDEPLVHELKQKLDAFIQVATRSLLENTTGTGVKKK